jgi:hypothetical protein
MPRELDNAGLGDRADRTCECSRLRGGPSALAYRPFDGTDAAVADPGQLEIELQPVGRLQEGSERFLFAPDVVFNFGLIKTGKRSSRGASPLLCLRRNHRTSWTPEPF